MSTVSPLWCVNTTPSSFTVFSPIVSALWTFRSTNMNGGLVAEDRLVGKSIVGNLHVIPRLGVLQDDFIAEVSDHLPDGRLGVTEVDPLSH